jgi:hypothetical protein
MIADYFNTYCVFVGMKPGGIILVSKLKATEQG